MVRMKDTFYELNQVLVTRAAFMRAYNENMPIGFPHVTLSLLKKFQDAHPTLFKHGDAWSLDRHRKKLMDWLPQNSRIS